MKPRKNAYALAILSLLLALLCFFAACGEAPAVEAEVTESTSDSESTSAPTTTSAPETTATEGTTAVPETTEAVVPFKGDPPQIGESGSVVPVGEISEEFKSVIDGNLFAGTVASGDKVLKMTVYSGENARVNFKVYDFYGNQLCELDVPKLRYSSGRMFYALSDGDCMVTFPYTAFYTMTVGSKGGMQTTKQMQRVIKFGIDGTLKFDVLLDCELKSEFIFETGDGYILVGECGGQIGYPSDIGVVKLDLSGNTVFSKIVGSLESDTLNMATYIDGTLKVYLYAGAASGDFSSRGSHVCVFDKDLNMTLTKEESVPKLETVHPRYNGKSMRWYWQMPSEIMYNTVGEFTSYMDYGDFYLLISEIETKPFEYTPGLSSSIWYYTETVYAAFSKKDHKLLWCTGVDSSNYEKFAEAEAEYKKNFG